MFRHNIEFLSEGQYSEENISKIKDERVFMHEGVQIDLNRRWETAGQKVFIDYNQYLLHYFQKFVSQDNVSDEMLAGLTESGVIAELNVFANNIIPNLESNEEYKNIARDFLQYKKDFEDVDCDFMNERTDEEISQAKKLYGERNQEIEQRLQNLNLDKNNECHEIKELLPKLLIQYISRQKDNPDDIPYITKEAFKEKFNNLIEKPCRKLIEYLVSQGHETITSNGFGTGIKGVAWRDKDSKQIYFTEFLSKKTYECTGGLDGYVTFPHINREKVHAVSPMDFSACWPKLIDFNQPDPATNVDKSKQPAFEIKVTFEENDLLPKQNKD